MKKIFLLSVTVAMMSSMCSATIRRVGYNGAPLSGIDYGDINSAQNASLAGDTIQVYGSANGAINKRLVIMGFGYNFEVHPGLQAVNLNAPSNVSLQFTGGSDGSIATGLSGSFYIGDVSGSRDTVSNITFQRCYGTFQFYNHQSYSSSSDTKILSCVITGGGMIWNGVNDNAILNLQVYNSIIYSFNLYKSATSASFINCVMPSPLIIGNYALGLNDAGVLVKNCIFGAAGANNTNTVFESNFFAVTQPALLPAGSNNRWGQTWANLFNRLGGTSDNPSYYGYADFDEDYFVLKAGSPAINGGFNAANQPTNAGIYGGELAYRYRLSGVPAVPSVYKLTAPSSAATANPYNVTISVRSNN